ncbi:hypothetical protein EBT31_18315, partial [bacterium]|nr:hypothetical protein [bacterium]
KTDGTLWVWGVNDGGQLGHNNVIPYSSPRQIPGTQWSVYDASGSSDGRTSFAIKTDGTLWAWGYNYRGDLGQNDATTINRSSPTQIPGTQWNAVSANYRFAIGIKTDGTLWTWGGQYGGSLGQNNNTTPRSSPVQVPGTQWSLENFENQIGPYVFAMKKIPQ